LCLENVLAARVRGADVLNYVEVTDFLKENGRVHGVVARESLGGAGEPFKVLARRIVCAVGPWTNPLLKKDDPGAPARVRTTKGVHVVYPGRLSKGGLLIPSARDNRVFFVLPWISGTLIGTTDTDYDGSADQVAAAPDDIRYLCEETQRVFPDIEIGEKNLSGSFAGLRPLIRQTGNASKVSREHAIFETPSGLIFITGGKYTTYRVIAAEAFQKVCGRRPSKPWTVYGAGYTPVSCPEMARLYGVPEQTAKRIVGKYGLRAGDVLAVAQRDPELKKPVDPGLPWIAAELVYAQETELARTEDDVLFRRLSVAPGAAGKSARALGRLREAVRRWCSVEPSGL